MRYEILFLYLYLGHLIGDVFLQTRSLSKNKSRFFSNQLLHSAVVTFVTMVVYLALDPLFWLVYAIIFVGHTIIDEIKCKLDPDNSSLSLLIIDQIVHFVFLAVLVFSIHIEQKTLYTSYSTPYFEQLMSPGFVRVAIIVSGLILCVPFGGEIVQKSIAKYVDINSSGEKRKLSKSDAIIAGMERILIFNFILTANIIYWFLLY